MNFAHRAFSPARRTHAAHRVTARVPVTADLFVGASMFATCEARVTAYRDDEGCIDFEMVEIQGFHGKIETWTPVEPPEDGKSIDMPHHAYDFVVAECRKRSMIEKIEDALDAAEAEYEV